MRKLRTMIIAVVAFVLLGAGLEYLVPQGIGTERLFDRMGWMKIQAVTLDVEAPLTAERVRRWLPGLEGKNIVLLKAGPLVEQLKKRPWVREVTIKKQFPNRLDISVSSKRAPAILVFKGQGFFMDAQGNLIEKVDPTIFTGQDLPLISRDHKDENDEWRIPELLRLLAEVREKLGPNSGEVSEARLGSYPTLRLFLTNFKMEIILSMENWPTQLTELAYLLQKPPMGLGAIRRVNLTLSKKAVVSSTLSN